jgi:serine-type D-Ala-D-Ala carboxypeptidase (penicillin-binding protein 5/6)
MLRVGDTFSMMQMFYAMMLPSGNDAAFLIADFFGEYLYNERYLENNDSYAQSIQMTFPQSYAGSWQFPDGVIKYFLREMNLNAVKMKMFSSNFDSPHGLVNKVNYSTAYDICVLTTKCMQIPLIRDIVKTQVYRTAPLSSTHEHPQAYVWENTNKLLGAVHGFIGCKTGITDVAGPCFSGCFESNGEKICVVVLNAKTLEQRWVEVPQMVEWAIKRKQHAKIYSQ